MHYIFVTGGVLSGLGKGIAAASIGALLEGAGFRVFMQKFDGYLNVDPGTMSPFEHGEVFVTDDGSETDLDIGHYERFTDRSLSTHSSYSSGRLYSIIIEKERRGDYLGKTVQIIPHLVDLVADKIKEGGESASADITIVEIGGTVGDLENGYFVEAIRELSASLAPRSTAFVHLSLLPQLGATGELKTKPTQASLRTLMSYGIRPDFLLLRADSDFDESIRSKISRLSGLHMSRIISAPNLESIYDVPLSYRDQGLLESLLDHFGIEPKQKPSLKAWEDLQSKRKSAWVKKRIAMVGKYTGLEDAYYSLNEGLRTAAWHTGIDLKIEFIDAEKLERDGTDLLKSFDGICVPGGFGVRGVEWMISACQYAREQKVPYVGICLWSQIMMIEAARNLAGLAGANSEEFDEKNAHMIVHSMKEFLWERKKGGTMRLGSYPCALKGGSRARALYGADVIQERHRHRYECNNAYREELEKAGLTFSGTSPDGQLVEIVEYTDHPFMVAVQFHPELQSRPTRPYPLFKAFLETL